MSEYRYIVVINGPWGTKQLEGRASLLDNGSLYVKCKDKNWVFSRHNWWFYEAHEIKVVEKLPV